MKLKRRNIHYIKIYLLKDLCINF